MRVWMKEIRLKKGLSQAKLAEMSGISASYLADIERGERNPVPDNAKKIAQCLGVDWTLFY